MLYITPAQLTDLITESLFLSTTFTHFAHPPTPNLFPVSNASGFVLFSIPHVSEMVQYLSFSV